jgi:hypothetical protein
MVALLSLWMSTVTRLPSAFLFVLVVFDLHTCLLRSMRRENSALSRTKRS